jgi:hypothetical protein
VDASDAIFPNVLASEQKGEQPPLCPIIYVFDMISSIFLHIYVRFVLYLDAKK